MRILFSFVGGRGHFEPLVPIARAARAAGHEVAFACPPSTVAMVEGASFAALAVGSQRSRPPVRTALLPPDRQREERDLRERFVRRAARDRAPRILELCRRWRPRVLVCDETDFGAMLAAERLGLPFATALVIASGSFVRADVVGEPLDALRAELRLPPDPGFEMPARQLVLSPFPPSLRDPAHPLPAGARVFRAISAPPRETGPEGAPPWPVARPGEPTVYLTLGTVFNMESGDLLSRMVSGLRALRANLVVTVGPDMDPAELGPQPSHVHVARTIPQAAVLPHCDLVVSHGGSGSLLAALTHGLASLLVPIGADQPLNAERCVQLGVGRVLDAVSLTPERARSAAAEVLGRPEYRRSAERLRDEIAQLPDASHAVAGLESLAEGELSSHPLVEGSRESP